MTAILPLFARIYTGFALLCLNSAAMFVGLNVVILGGLAIWDRLTAAPNVVAAKYGEEPLLRVYPGKTREQISDLLNETWLRRQRFEPYTMFKEAPFHGQYVKVHSAGFRHSSEQRPWPPPESAFVVFLFGGSTTFGYGVADHETIGSFLQAGLQDIIGREVHLYNFGTGAYQSTQERIAFGELLIDGHRPDLAIFIDGLNEFGFPHVPRDTDYFRRLLDGDWRSRARWMFSEVIGAMPMITLAARLQESPASDGSGSSGVDTALVESVIARYVANVHQTNAAAEAHSVDTIFVWQPSPFYNYDRAHHPFFNAARNPLDQKGYEIAAARLPVEVPGKNFFWLADMQQHLREPLYVDNVHYTTAMSERVANAVLAMALERGLMPTVEKPLARK